jgi:hypothetical protein
VDFGCRANEKQKKTMIHSLFLEGFFSWLTWANGYI